MRDVARRLKAMRFELMTGEGLANQGIKLKLADYPLSYTWYTSH